MENTGTQDSNGLHYPIIPGHVITQRVVAPFSVFPGQIITIWDPTEDQIARPYTWFRPAYGIGDITIEFGLNGAPPMKVIGDVGGDF